MVNALWTIGSILVWFFIRIKRLEKRLAEPATEQPNIKSEGLDILPPAEILSLLYNAQLDAANSVAQSIQNIEFAAKILSEAINAGGNIIYSAAGSSAFMGLADGLELPGTFGIHKDRIKMLIAGNTGSMTDFSNFAEDDVLQAAADVDAAKLTEDDCMICISASGTTPYAVAALEAARDIGAKTIGIANNPDTPILKNSDVAIFLNTPPEIIPGSTRMGAATAQKITLNLMTTLMGIHLGHVHDGYMVNVQVDNIKLHKRACSIISNTSGCTLDDARNYLDNSNGCVKLAIMMASGAPDMDEAKKILERNSQKLRLSLSVLKGL